MQICNDADLGTEYSFPQNQNITGKAPRLLPCSSIASCPDQGSDLITTSQTGEEKEYPDHKWYYMFLRNRELKRYIEIFTGRRAVMINTRSGMKEERYFCFKVFHIPLLTIKDVLNGVLIARKNMRPVGSPPLL